MLGFRCQYSKDSADGVEVRAGPANTGGAQGQSNLHLPIDDAIEQASSIWADNQYLTRRRAPPREGILEEWGGWPLDMWVW